MNRYIFTLFFVLIHNVFFSQKLLISSGNKQIDQWCDNAIELVTQDGSKNFRQSMELIKKAHTLALKEGNVKADCIAHFAEATILKRAGSFDVAIATLNNALNQTKKLTEPEKTEILAYTYHYLGFIHQSKSDWKKSLDSYYKALVYANKMQDKTERIIVLTRIGDIFQAMGDSKNAEKYFLEALEKNDRKHPMPTIDAYISYANMLLDADPKKAIQMSEKALEIAHKNGIDSKDYNIYFNFSGAYFTLKNLPKSIEMMNKAIENAQKNHKSLTQFYLGLGQIKEADSKPKESEKFYKKAIQEARNEKDLYMEMQTYSYLKDLYKKNGKIANSLRRWSRKIF